MKNRLLILFLRFLSRLPLPLARRLGTFLGACAERFGTRMWQTTCTNLELCFPDWPTERRRALARSSIRETFRAIAEAGAVWLWPAEKILGRVRRVRGRELLEAAQREGRGVIVVGPHLGNWELIGLWLGHCGLGPTVQLFQAPADPAFAALIYQARSRSGATMVPTDAKGVTQLLKALRAGHIIGILPDQVPPESGGEFDSFFGVPALTMTLLSKLLAKTGARAVMGTARRLEEPEAGFEIVFGEVDPRLYEQDLALSLRGLNASVEATVLEAPAQYQWEYKRFKRQPPGLPRPY